MLVPSQFILNCLQSLAIFLRLHNPKSQVSRHRAGILGRTAVPGPSAKASENLKGPPFPQLFSLEAASHRSDPDSARGGPSGGIHGSTGSEHARLTGRADPMRIDPACAPPFGHPGLANPDQTAPRASRCHVIPHCIPHRRSLIAQEIRIQQSSNITSFFITFNQKNSAFDVYVHPKRHGPWIRIPALHGSKSPQRAGSLKIRVTGGVFLPPRLAGETRPYRDKLIDSPR